jgi:hypothetical protein
MSKCGIGLAVRLAANGMFQVEDMTPNTPSQLCGFFKKGDLITAVDGNSVIGFTMDQFVDAVLGEPGSDITVLPALDPFFKAPQRSIKRFCRLQFNAKIATTSLPPPTVCRTLCNAADQRPPKNSAKCRCVRRAPPPLSPAHRDQLCSG